MIHLYRSSLHDGLNRGYCFSVAIALLLYGLPFHSISAQTAANPETLNIVTPTFTYTVAIAGAEGMSLVSSIGNDKGESHVVQSPRPAAETLVASPAKGTITVASAHPDYAALADFYAATNGPNWTNKTGWLTSSDPCSGWNGVFCTNGRVTTLNQLYNNLSGTLPVSLTNLTNLRSLAVYGNTITGPIPEFLTTMTSLRQLGLGSNKFTGTIPTSLTALTNLEGLSLSGNQLTGQIPAALANLSNLKDLYLSDNQLTGSIPASLSTLSSLQNLVLSRNQLSGTLPEGLGQLTMLRFISIESNQISGTIPASFSGLVNMETLAFSFNQLSGTIPTWIGSLPKLRALLLGINQLTGTIPTSITNLAGTLDFLTLSQNSLTGTIPQNIGVLNKLTAFDVNTNRLTGTIPASVSSLTALTDFRLHNNQLTGRLPERISSMTALSILFLYSNQLTGCIPVSYSALCGRTVSINNAGLSNGGNWTAFCSQRTGSELFTNSTQEGDWHNPVTWTCGQVPRVTDTVTIQHPVSLTAITPASAARLRYLSGGRLIQFEGSRLQIGQ